MAGHLKTVRIMGFTAALCAALAAGGCAGPMYAGAPDDMYYASPRSQDRSYVGGEVDDEYEQQQPADETWTAEQQYEYRGGRDPVTGRAQQRM